MMLEGAKILGMQIIGIIERREAVTTSRRRNVSASAIQSIPKRRG